MDQIVNTDINDLEKNNIKELFELCIAEIKNATHMSNDDKLYLYKYYKQATIGDINIPQPSWYDFVGKEKYKAWKSVEDTSKDISMKRYIEKVQSFFK